jgi:transposase
MKKSSKKQQGGAGTESRPEKVVGLDLGDRYSHYCMLTGSGEVMEEGRIQTNAAALEKHFGTEPRMRIALEAGTHSGWVSRLLKSYGHQVIVANPRKIPTLTASKSKNDRNDAKQLARMAAFDPELLHPIQHRSAERQQDLNLIHTRSVLVRARTMLINSARGLVKSAGGRLPACSSEAFSEKVPAAVPPALKTACTPLLKQIAQINQTIAAMDKQIDGLDKKYPEIAILRTAPGVGPVVAACYVLTLDSPQAMETNRQAGGLSRPQAGPATVWRLQPAVWHHQDGQYLPAQFTGAVGAIHPGPLWPQLGATPLGTQAGRQWWQTGQETCPRCRGPQAGRDLAQHVAQPQEI